MHGRKNQNKKSLENRVPNPSFLNLEKELFEVVINEILCSLCSGIQ